MNICDEIETFLLDALGNEHSVLIARNNLAAHFDCAPSQINYVLTTRFTPERGFVTSSRRGGGGYIEITRIRFDDILGELLRGGIGEEISFGRARGILESLEQRGVLSPREFRLLSAALTDGALVCPMPIKDKLRANIVKSVILEIMKEEEKG